VIGTAALFGANERHSAGTDGITPMWEREAERLLTLPNPPDIGPGGEVAREQSSA